MNSSLLKELDALIVSGRLGEAKRLVTSALKRTPDDHRLLTRMARVLSDADRNGEALVWHRRALKIAPTCPVAIWDYAETIGGRRAIQLFRGLIRRGPARLSTELCVPSVAAGRGLITDAYWMVAVWNWRLGDRAGALRAAQNCLRRVRGGAPGRFVRARAARTVLHWAQALKSGQSKPKLSPSAP